MKAEFRNGYLRLFLAVLTFANVCAYASEKTKVAITIDDFTIHGPTLPTESRMAITQRFLAVLKQHRIGEAYGFVNAKKVDDEPETRETLVAWLQAGYPLGNHSYSHMDLNKHSADEFIQDIKQGEPLLKELSPSINFKWFRYPFLHEGNTLDKRNAVREALSQMGYRIAEVTVDFEDYAWNEPYVRCQKQGDQKSIAWLRKSYLQNALRRLKWSMASSRKLYGRQIKHVLLLHIGLFDSLILDDLFTAYEKSGVEFVSLAEASADPIYEMDPKVTSRPGSTFLDWVHIAKKIPMPHVAPLPFKQLARICPEAQG